MRALLVATSWPSSAGEWQGRFIFDMAASLAQHPDLSLSLWAPPGPRPEDITDDADTSDTRWLAQMLQAGGIAHLLRHGRIDKVVDLLSRLRRLYRRADADVFHINWLQNALPLPQNRRPLLLTALGTDYRLLSLPGMTTLLRRVLAGRPTIIAPNAGWMVPGLAERFGDIAEVRPIPFGVAERWYAVKRQAGTGAWLAVTRLTRAKIGDLLTWGEGLFGSGRTLHLLGPMQEEISLPDWLHYHGPVSPNDLSDIWFPNCDGIISLSRHPEGRPQVLLEALAAGLPVIASDLPAHRDLVPAIKIVGSREEFATSLQRLASPDENRRQGAISRAFATETIGTWTLTANRYMEAYRQLCESSLGS